MTEKAMATFWGRGMLEAVGYLSYSPQPSPPPPSPSGDPTSTGSEGGLDISNFTFNKKC